MKIFLSVMLITITFNSQAQEVKDSSFVEKYCILKIGGVAFSTKVSAIIDLDRKEFCLEKTI